MFDALPSTPDLFPQPIPFDFAMLESCEMTGIIAYGIFNPMGPTLSIVSLLHHKAAEKSLIHFLMLNPFAQESAVIGVLPKEPDQEILMEVVPQAFAINDFSDFALVGGLPTFILHGGTKELFDVGLTCLSRHVAANERTAEVAEQFQILKQYAGHPWDRASFEMDQALNAVLAKDNDSATAPSRPPQVTASESTVPEWLKFLISSQHLKSELAGFLQAWAGSIDVQNGSCLAHSAMSMKQMLLCTGQSNPEFMIQMQSAIR